MKKQIIKLTETDLHNIVKSVVDKTINEVRGNALACYWKCEFTDEQGNTIEKMIFGKNLRDAQRHAYELGMRDNLTPNYETLRSATAKEYRDFMKMIKNRIGK